MLSPDHLHRNAPLKPRAAAKENRPPVNLEGRDTTTCGGESAFAPHRQSTSQCYRLARCHLMTRSSGSFRGRSSIGDFHKMGLLASSDKYQCDKCSQQDSCCRTSHESYSRTHHKSVQFSSCRNTNRQSSAVSSWPEIRDILLAVDTRLVQPCNSGCALRSKMTAIPLQSDHVSGGK
jgi:hypothetical protein